MGTASCRTEGCFSTALARGLCQKHYMRRWRRARDPQGYAARESLQAVRDTWAVLGLRQCEKCGAILRAETPWFSRNEKSAGGFEFTCEECRLATQSQRGKIGRLSARRVEERAHRDELFRAGLAQCTVCYEVKLTEEFVRDRRNTNGVGCRCKSCTAKRSRGYRHTRKYGLHKTACGDYYDRWCSDPCYVCEKRWHKNLIHAHHRQPNEKKYNLNKLTCKSEVFLPLIEVELSKCAPLCGNCHGLVHVEMQNGGKHLTFDELVALVRRKYYPETIPALTA